MFLSECWFVSFSQFAKIWYFQSKLVIIHHQDQVEIDDAKDKAT